MTGNIYLGANLGAVLRRTDFVSLAPAVTATFAAVEATNVPARMEAIAALAALVVAIVTQALNASTDEAHNVSRWPTSCCST